MSLRPLDTTTTAWKAQRSAFGKLGPEGRLRAALEMSDAMRRIRLSGIRSRHPEATEREAISRFIAGAHGTNRDRMG